MKHLTSKNINNYLDNDISYDDKIFIEKHIQNCEKCKNMFLLYNDIHQSLKLVQIYHTKPNFSNIILDNVIKEKKKHENSDLIILSSIIGFIFLLLISLFIILRLFIQNTSIITPKKQINVFTNFDIIWQLIRSLNFEISKDVILIAALVSLLIIIFLINETYQKIKVISGLKNEIQ